MCITTATARLSKTLIYVGEGIRNDNEVRVMAYQNNAHSDGPNAMVLPFPTDKEMGPDNIIDTRSFKGFLRNIADATKMRTLGMDDRIAFNGTKGVSRGMAQVFNSGSYTVVLAENVDQIPEALERVPENKRPSISPYFLFGYGKLYPDQPIAVCCWDGTIQAEPLLAWYSPKNKDHLFVPTMDAHDGGPPRLTDVVQTDHIISVGSVTDRYMNRQNKVNYRDTLPASVLTLLPQHVYGTKLGSTYKNGDMFLATEALNKQVKKYSDIPRMKRGATFLEATVESRDFEMYGWG
jgi:hypothetical protein